MKSVFCLLLLINVSMVSLGQTHSELADQAMNRMKASDFKGALNLWDRAISLNQKELWYYYNRGLCKNNLQDYIGGIQDFNIYIRAVPNDGDGYHERARCKFHLEDYRGAIQDLNLAISINSSKAESYYMRGHCKYQINDFNGGCLDFSKAGELGYKKAYQVIREFCN